jgi:hypothetical protein
MAIERNLLRAQLANGLHALLDVFIENYEGSIVDEVLAVAIIRGG